MTADPLRVYEVAGDDGYPPEWHETVKHLVRDLAGHRCVRCHHPYRTGEHPMERVETPVGVRYESWSPCDALCVHGGPARVTVRGELVGRYPDADVARAGWDDDPDATIETLARILTVHHLNGVKLDCRWWNLAALCQRCHLTVQRRVQLPRVWPWPHSDWFKPYAAGWYAHAYLGEALTRDETVARLDELLALELAVDEARP